eukprot:c11832_g1_i1.p1 GENE.c11832_g1_i1~~c11832_g1_i1.p1  ORF type:complete len:750 (-),score=218.78 c11832_g1_i1:183-2432(-)
MASPRPSPQKKIVIKPFNVPPSLPEAFEEESWRKLHSAIVAIQTNKAITHSEEELYRICQDMCVHKKGELLYSRLRAACDIHINQSISALSGAQVCDEDYLVMVNRCWENSCRQMMDIRLIFLFLDRTYVPQAANSKIKYIWNMGLDLFRQYLLQVNDVLKKTIDGMLATIQNERRGEAVDHALCKSVVRMLSSLQLYKECFQPRLLVDTSTFYRDESRRMLTSLEVSDFLLYAERRLREESARCELYLEPSTSHVLRKTTEMDILSEHVTKELIEKGFDSLFDQARLEDLKRMYELFQKVKALSFIRQRLKSFVEKVGLSIVADDDVARNHIQELLTFRLKQDAIVADAFASNKDFANGLQETWEKILNERQNHTAEMLAKFVDSKLRKGETGSEDDDMEVLLDRVMMLFRHIQAKDVFEAFYKKDLAKRLIVQKFASIDAENSMISKLKGECGSGYTAKLESMFKDMEISKDIMLSFNESKARLSLKEVSLDVKVLSTNCWPTYPPCEVVLTKEMCQYQEIFQKFYLQKHSGRCLKWMHSLGSAMLQGKFLSHSHHATSSEHSAHSAARWIIKEVQVSIVQAVCLLLFNRHDTIAYADIKEATRIDHVELKRTLQSLACGKIKILKKSPKGKDVDEDDVFSVDDVRVVENKLFRLRIPNIQAKETTEENVKTHDGVVQDRQYQIDAAIVRIMKTRKTLSHTLLVSQLFSQLKFPVKTQDLKKRIESLIEREYMQRDKTQHTVYHYLA